MGSKDGGFARRVEDYVTTWESAIKRHAAEVILVFALALTNAVVLIGAYVIIG